MMAWAPAADAVKPITPAASAMVSAIAEANLLFIGGCPFSFETNDGSLASPLPCRIASPADRRSPAPVGPLPRPGAHASGRDHSLRTQVTRSPWSKPHGPHEI